MGVNKSKLPAEIVPDDRIIARYWQGSTIKQLTEHVAGAEQISKQAAKEKVEWAIYNHLKRDGLSRT